jgi:hypothetical protein
MNRFTQSTYDRSVESARCRTRSSARSWSSNRGPRGAELVLSPPHPPPPRRGLPTTGPEGPLARAPARLESVPAPGVRLRPMWSKLGTKPRNHHPSTPVHARCRAVDTLPRDQSARVELAPPPPRHCPRISGRRSINNTAARPGMIPAPTGAQRLLYRGYTPGTWEGPHKTIASTPHIVDNAPADRAIRVQVTNLLGGGRCLSP